MSTSWKKWKRKEINWWWWWRYPSIWREKWSKNFSWRFLKRRQGRCRNGLIAGVLVIAGNTDITAVYISRRLVNAGNFPRHRYPPLLLKTPGKTPIMLFAVFFLEFFHWHLWNAANSMISCSECISCLLGVGDILGCYASPLRSSPFPLSGRSNLNRCLFLQIAIGFVWCHGSWMF